MTDGFKPACGLIEQLEKPAHCEQHGDYVSMGIKMMRNTHWRGCPACEAAASAKRAEEEAAQVARREQERMEARINRAGIPFRYRSKDFASFVADTDAKERALAIAMEFAQNYDEHMRKGTVIVFSGLPGTGKSHLAIAIALAVMASRTALYTSAIDAVRMVRDTWRKGAEKTETEVLDMLSSLGLLILDEVGVQYGTDAEQVTLFDIIDKRYRDMMPMILLTNQNKAGMKQFLGDRSFDRLREGGLWVTFDWDSHRGSAK
jgi:DNA replication protein DnaC